MNKAYALLLIIFFSAGLSAQQGSDSPVLENQSKLSFSETIDKIKFSAEEKGWKVLVVHDLQASLKKNGQEVLPVSVIEVCKPAFSGEVLKTNDNRALSVLMPCRVAVYEKEDGGVYVSRLNTAGLQSSGFDEDAIDVMSKASDEIEVLLEEMIIEK